MSLRLSLNLLETNPSLVFYLKVNGRYSDCFKKRENENWLRISAVQNDQGSVLPVSLRIVTH